MANNTRGLQRRVARRLDDASAPLRGTRALVAVSGGVDSTVLLHVLATLAPERGLHLAVLHVDHGLRPESAAEGEHVARLADAFALPFHGARVDVARRADGGVSEEAARDARHGAFRSVAASIGATVVVTGHTADDQAETLLLRLGRGTGPRGLAAMPTTGRIAGDLGVVRPLLGEPRRDVVAYARENGLAWVEDPSNATPTWLRNRVRQTLLPAFEALFGDRVADRIAALADDLGDEREAVAGLVAALEGTVWRRSATDDAATLDVGRLSALPRAARRHVIVHALDAVGARTGFGRPHVAAVLSLAASTAGSASVDLPGDLVAERRYGALRLGPRARADAADAGAPTEADGVRIEGPGCVPWSSWALTVERLAAAPRPLRVAPEDVWLDAGTSPFPLALRRVRPGERVALPGVGRRKVSRLLVDRKVPCDLRDTVRLLVDRDETPLAVLWAGGDPGDRTRHGIAADPAAFSATSPVLARTSGRRVPEGRGPVVHVRFEPGCGA